MAEDFLPVGIKAVVVGVDDFLADLRRMQAGVAKFGESVKDSAADLRGFGASARATSEAARAFANEAGQMAQGARQVNTSVSALNKTIAGLAQKMGAASPRAQQFSVSLTGTRTSIEQTQNAATRFFNTMASGVDRMLRGTNIYRNQAQAVADLKRRVEELKNATAQLEREVEENAQAVVKSEQAFKSARSAYQQNLESLRKVEQELREVGQAYNEFREQGGTASQANQRFGATLDRLGQQFARLIQETYRSGVATQQAQARWEQARAQAGALSSQLADSRFNLSFLSAELAGASNRLGLLNAGIALVTGGLRALGIAATAAAAGVTALKLGLSALTAPIRGLNSLFVKAVNKVKGLNSQLTQLASRAFRVGNSIRFLGTSLTFLITFPIVGFLGKMTNAAIDFEEAWAGVVRTASEAGEDVPEGFKLIADSETDIKNLTEAGENLRQAIRELALEIPLPAAELARLGEIAGTLGIRGNKNLIAFIETAARLGSTTNIAAEDAAIGLGKLIGVAGGLSDAELAMVGWSEAQIEGATSSERFQQSAVSLGGVLTALGNETEAFESEILNFGRKISGVGNAIGLTSSEVLGFSSAFVRAGVDAARGGTAFQKVMTGILRATQEGGEALEIFSLVAGTTVEDFVKLFEEDASEAIRFFIEGIGQAGEEGVRVLEALDLADARVAASILSLAATQGDLTDSLKIVTDELEAQGKSMGEMNALLLESERRYSTTKSQVQLLKNQFNDLGITIGDFLLPHINTLVTRVRGIIETFSRLSPQVQKFILISLGLIAVIGPIVTGIGLMLASFGFLFKVVFSAIGVILSLASTLGLAVFPIFALAAAIAGLVIAFAASFKKIDRFANETGETLVTKMFAFGKNIILAFAKGMAAAIIAVVRVLNEIGKVISKWLKPGSPPALLPDLDKWGTGAMQSYMDGWLAADFGVFNKIADKVESFLRSVADTADEAGRVNLVERIIGSRRVIAKATEEIRKLGKVTSATMKRIEQVTAGASSQFRRFIKAMVDVKVASEQVKRAQEEVNRIMEEYEKALKPIEDRLKQIDKRQQAISDRSRIIELEAVLADPRAPEIVRELAQLEIEEIGLNAEASQVEEIKDQQLELAEAELDAAQARLDAAEEELAAAEAMLDVTIKNNELLQEMKQAAEEVKNKMEEAFSAGGIEGFDPAGLNLDELLDEDAGLIDDLLADLEVDSIADTISEAFGGLVEEIKKEFEPLLGEGGLFDQLGTTWAPIFETIFDLIDRYLPKAEDVLGTIDRWNEGSQELAETIGGALDGAIRDVSAILIELGIIEPFGPFLEEGQEMETIVTRMRGFIDDLREKVLDFLLNHPVGRGIFAAMAFFINTLKVRFRLLKEALEPLVNAWNDSLRPALEAFAETVSNAWEQADGLREILGTLATVIGIVLGAVFALVQGIFAGLVQGLARAIEFASVFIGNFIERIGQLISGVIGFFEGLVGIVKGIIELVKGNSDEGTRLIQEGWQRLVDGVWNILEGLVAGILELLGAGFAAIIGLVLGFVEGVITFFVGLYNALVGNSIVTDLVNDMVELFAKAWEWITEGVKEFVSALVEKIAEVAQTIIDGIQVGLDWLAELPGKLWDAGVNAIQGFIDGITSIDVGQKIKDIGGGILGGIKSALGISSPSREFEEVGEDSMEGWIRGVESKLGKIADLYEKTSAQVVKAVEQMHTLQNKIVDVSLKDQADNYEGFAEAVVTIIEKMYEVKTQLTEMVLEQLNRYIETWLLNILDMTEQFGGAYSLDGTSSLWGQILNAVEKMWVEHIKQMRKLIGQIVDMFLQMLKDIKQAFANQQGAFRSTGQGLINSLISGLNSRAGALMARARAIAQAVSATINDAFDVGSPSKVFLDIGKNLVESWALGMESKEGKLLNAVTDLAGSLAGQQAIQPALASGAFRQAAPAVPGSTTFNREVNIDLGGQQINNGMDAFELQLLIEDAVRNAIG
jgi:TP901 family phage tail tape measure protein